MGPYEMFPSQFQTLTGGQTGCDGCRWTYSTSIEPVRNQLSGALTGVPPYTVTSPGAGQLNYSLPLYQSRPFPALWPLLVSGAVDVTWRGTGYDGWCLTTTGGFYYPSGSGQICYESGRGCQEMFGCDIFQESIQIRVSPSLYGPSFPSSIATGLWVVTVVNTAATGTGMVTSWVLNNTTGTTGFAYNPAYHPVSGLLYSLSSSRLACGTSRDLWIDIDYFVNGLGYSSGQWLGRGTYHIPTLSINRGCNTCAGL